MRKSYLPGGGGDLKDSGRGHLLVGLDSLLPAIEVALGEHGKLEALHAFRRRTTHDDVQGGHGRQVEIEIKMIAAADEDGGGVFHFGSSSVVRGQVNHVKRTINLRRIDLRTIGGSGSIRRARLTNRGRVYCIPRLGCDGDEVGSSIEGREFE